MTPDEMQQVNEMIRRYEEQLDRMLKAMGDMAAREMPPVIQMSFDADAIGAAIAKRVEQEPGYIALVDTAGKPMVQVESLEQRIAALEQAMETHAGYIGLAIAAVTARK